MLEDPVLVVWFDQLQMGDPNPTKPAPDWPNICYVHVYYIIILVYIKSKKWHCY